MRKIIGLLALGLTVVFSPTDAQANDLSFTTGVGYPYFVTLEGSMAANNDQDRWYLNYNMGLDDGFALGFERGYGEGNNHAFGGFVGAVGMYNGDDCVVDKDEDNIGALFGQTLGCALAEAFDDETLNGAGLSYSYYFSSINQSGWRVRLQAGYGKASKSDEKRGAGTIMVSYQF